MPLLSEERTGEPDVNPVPLKDVASLRGRMAKVFTCPEVRHFIREIVVRLRNDERVATGPTPRVVPAIEKAVRVTAIFDDLGFATPSHVLRVVGPVLEHRIVVRAVQPETAAVDSSGGPTPPRITIVPPPSAGTSSSPSAPEQDPQQAYDPRSLFAQILCSLLRSIAVPV